MRVFIAVDLPKEIRKTLADVQHELRPMSNSVRWVSPESIHITLKFIGEMPEKRLEDIDAALTGFTWKPFTITVRGVGFFPGNRSPRVFWAGMEAPTMKDMAEELDTRMERLGFDKEKRAFRPTSRWRGRAIRESNRRWSPHPSLFRNTSSGRSQWTGSTSFRAHCKPQDRSTRS